MGSDLGRLKGFVLTLGTEGQRYDRATIIKSKSPVRTEIVSAVNGYAFSQEQIRDLIGNTARFPMYPFPIKPGEIGCLVSHRKIWELIIRDETIDAGLILEDDIDFEPSWIEAVCRKAMAKKKEYQVLRIPINKNLKGLENKSKYFWSEDEIQIDSTFLPRLGTQAQIITKQGAKMLLESKLIADRPIDVLLQMTWVTKTNVATVRNSRLEDMTLKVGGSTIQKKVKGANITRNMLRSKFRFLVLVIAISHEVKNFITLKE